MISVYLVHSNFIYLPTEIWETTRSKSSRQGYFQISPPCKDCKWTKHYFIIFDINDLEGSNHLFWHLRVGEGWGGEGSTVDFLPIVWLRFQLPFVKSLKILFQPQSFECIQVRSNHVWINRNSGTSFRLFPSCYISEFLHLLSYFSDNLAWLTIAKIALLELLCLACLLGNFF